MPQVQAPAPVGVRPPSRSLRSSMLPGGAEGGSPRAAEPDVERSASSMPTAKVTVGFLPPPGPPSAPPPRPCFCHSYSLLLHSYPLSAMAAPQSNAAFSSVKSRSDGAGACSSERLSQAKCRKVHGISERSVGYQPLPRPACLPHPLHWLSPHAGSCPPHGSKPLWHTRQPGTGWRRGTGPRPGAWPRRPAFVLPPSCSRQMGRPTVCQTSTRSAPNDRELCC